MSGDTADMSFDSGLLAPPPLLRRLGPADAPFPGDLRAGTPPAVWIPVQELPKEIWRVRSGEHVLTPVDLARTPGGHTALLPHCPHRLIALAGARAWEAGAIVTAAVSVLRGAAEAERCGFTVGSWWVDADGCPLLAPTGPPWQDETVALLTELAEAAPAGLRQTVLAAATLISERRVTPARRERVEGELFAAADPAPLPPVGATGETAGPLLPRRAVQRERDSTDLTSDAPTWATALIDRDVATRLLHVLAGLRSAPRRAMAVLRRRRPDAAPERGARPAASPTTASAPTDDRPRRRRGAPLLVAAAAAAIIVVGGLAWPGNESTSPTASEAAASTPSTGDREVSGPTATPDPGASEPPAPAAADGDEGGAIARRLLADLATCSRAQNADCSDILEDPTNGIPAGVVIEDAELREVTLLDEYGGVAAYRVSGGQHPSQVLVVVHADGKWLIRDVYDVADQP